MAEKAREATAIIIRNKSDYVRGRKFGLLGRRLGHSLSPEIHSLLGDYEYRLYEVEPEYLSSFIEGTDLDGFNVTIPYKESVLPLCRDLTPRAASIGSVNTMKRLPGGGFLGDNTDYTGFALLLDSVWGKESLSDEEVLVLGSGGASKAVCAVLKDRGASVRIVSRSGDLNYTNVFEKAPGCRLIVNTTPVGMYPDEGQSPLDLRPFANLEAVIDIIYNPEKTALILQAEALGLKAGSGLTMLLGQAAAADFGGSKPNIVLIGMPGAGKTTLGRKLAAGFGRVFVDTDDETEKKTGLDIPEIFRLYGEEEFRKIETGILRELSKKEGLVIATGGGIVTRAENREYLSNTRVVHVRRPLESLPSDGRPLSVKKGVEQLWKERKDFYEGWSDIEILL